MNKLLNFGIPKEVRGSTIKLFSKAGFHITKGSVPYLVGTTQIEAFVRAQEMSRYVEDGFFDCGLTEEIGQENDSNVRGLRSCLQSIFK